MLKRLKWIALLLLPLGLAGAYLAYSVDSAHLASSMVTQLRESAGLEAKVAGPVTWNMLPRPTIRIDNVAIADSSGALRVTAGTLSLKGNLRLSSLLAGHIEFDHIELVRPRISLDLDQMGHSGQAVATVRQPGLVSISNGTLSVKSLVRQLDFELTEVNAKLDWPQRDGPLAFKGRARLMDRPLTLSLWVANPVDWLQGGQSAASTNFRGGETRLVVRGNLIGGPDGRFAGHMMASGPSLSHVLAMGPLGSPISPSAEPFSLTGNIGISAREFVIDQMRATLLGSEYDGALAWRSDPAGQSLSGTLASELIEATPVIQILRALAQRAPNWATVPLAWDPSNSPQLDLRVSIASIRAKRWQVDDAALSIRGRGREYDIELADARAFSANFAGKMTVALNGALVKSTLSAEAVHADLAGLCLSLHCPVGLTGNGNGGVDLQASGADVRSMLDNIDGNVRAELSGGWFTGIDLAQVLRRVEKHASLAVANLHEGTSAFDKANIDVTLKSDIATLDRAIFTGPEAQVNLSGTVDMTKGLLVVRGIASQPAHAAQSSISNPTFRFNLAGPVKNPVFTPELDDRGLGPTQ